MRRNIVKPFAALFIGAVVAIVNIALFAAFPLLHGMFSDSIRAIAAPGQAREVIMEFRKPEKKDEVPEQRLMKQMVAKTRGASSKQMQFRFTPDLAVEGSGGVAMEDQDLSAVVFEEGETDEPLIPLYRPNLTFSERARELEIEGILEVILVVDTDGKVASIDVVRTPHPLITAEARRVISKWRFKPAKNKGVPVRVRLRQVVEFRLD